MTEEKIEIVLLRASDDPPVNAPEFQKERLLVHSEVASESIVRQACCNTIGQDFDLLTFGYHLTANPFFQVLPHISALASPLASTRR